MSDVIYMRVIAYRRSSQQQCTTRDIRILARLKPQLNYAESFASCCRPLLCLLLALPSLILAPPFTRLLGRLLRLLQATTMHKNKE